MHDARKRNVWNPHSIERQGYGPVDKVRNEMTVCNMLHHVDERHTTPQDMRSAYCRSSIVKSVEIHVRSTHQEVHDKQGTVQGGESECHCKTEGDAARFRW